MSINEKPLRHTSKNLTLFTANRSDLRDGVKVEKPEYISEEDFVQDVAEFVAWHCTNIWEQLNGFQGYACTRFSIHIVKE